MGLFIGGTVSSAGPRTWGSLRSIIFNGTIITTAAGGSHNIEYQQGFKTAAGNGYVRTDYSGLYQGNLVGGPNITASGLTASPPLSELASYYSFNGLASASGMLVNEDRAQLTGETVTMSSGTVTITSAAFVAPTYQTYSAYNASETITAIGKLTAF